MDLRKSNDHEEAAQLWAQSGRVTITESDNAGRHKTNETAAEAAVDSSKNKDSRVAVVAVHR